MSLSGFCAVSPASFIARKTGLSDSFSRIHSEMASSTSENRNGMRQPQAFHAASPSTASVASTTANDRMKPPATDPWMKLV